nr:TPA: ATPase F0 subunit 6 [Bdellodrilus illuminatus]
MMPDIFSSFDYYEHNHPFMFFSFIAIILLPSFEHLMSFSTYNTLDKTLYEKMKMYFLNSPNFKNKNIYFYNQLIMYIFILIIYMNITGLFPYMFSWTSHMMFTWSLAFPCWISLVLSSMMFKPKQFMAHLLPDGAPLWLNPALVIFESISILVRPLTLAFRLAANMSAGHIVLILMTSFLVPLLFNCSMTTITLLMTLTFFTMFEMAICMIQAFIFFLLLSLYINDHT